MTTPPDPQTGDRALLDVAGLSALLAWLRGEGFRVVGPVARDGAIAFSDLRGAEDLPAGWTDEQAPGRYRLARREDGALFGYATTAQGLKPFLFAPRVTLVRLRRKEDTFEAEAPAPRAEPVAVLGARPCDLAAVAVQDRVLLQGAHPDPDYAARRARLFVIAVQCGVAGGTCFCASMGTGPRADRGFDLALTELIDDERGHRFLVEVGSEAGARALAGVPGPTRRDASEGDVAAALAQSARVAANMGRATPADEHRELLARTLEHPRWDDVAARCLSCTNCTMACPTCFCSTVEDTADLTGQTAERARRWDSCFTLDHSYLSGGGPARPTVRARYRQWLTHKLGTWIDQFGSSGCVGCGRCITWCPAGIDITEEIAALRSADGQGGGGPVG